MQLPGRAASLHMLLAVLKVETLTTAARVRLHMLLRVGFWETTPSLNQLLGIRLCLMTPHVPCHQPRMQPVVDLSLMLVLMTTLLLQVMHKRA
jgi:hypothetical protein